MSTELHARHFQRVIGEKVVFDSLGVDSLQKYVDKRQREGVGRDTIHKELSTLRVVWTWALKSPTRYRPPCLEDDRSDASKGR